MSTSSSSPGLSKTARLRATRAKTMDESIGVRRIGEGALAPAPATPSAPPPRLAGLGKDATAAMIPVDRIVPDPDQPRKTIEPEQLELLAATVRKRGVLLPIRVRYDGPTGRYVIVAGQRRWQAARLAGLEMIPCRIAGDDEGEDVLLDQMIENSSRVDVPPMEQARGYRALRQKKGWTITQLAEEVGVTQPTVSRSLALLALLPEVQEKIEDGSISAAVGYELSKLKDPSQSLDLMDEAIVERWTRSAVAAEVVRLNALAGLAPRRVKPIADPPGNDPGPDYAPRITPDPVAESPPGVVSLPGWDVSIRGHLPNLARSEWVARIEAPSDRDAERLAAMILGKLNSPASYSATPQNPLFGSKVYRLGGLSPWNAWDGPKTEQVRAAVIPRRELLDLLDSGRIAELCPTPPGEGRDVPRSPSATARAEEPTAPAKPVRPPTTRLVHRTASGLMILAECETGIDRAHLIVALREAALKEEDRLRAEHRERMFGGRTRGGS